MSQAPPPDENDPTLHMTEADKQHLQLFGSAAQVRVVFDSYVQAGFSEEQALELLKHVMSIGMQATVIREIEAKKRQPRSLFEIFGLKAEADKKPCDDIPNQQHLTKEEPTDGDAAPQGD